MAGEGNELVVVGVLVSCNRGLLDGALPFALGMEPLQYTIDIVSEFGLCVKVLQIGRIRNWDYGIW